MSVKIGGKTVTNIHIVNKSKKEEDKPEAAPPSAPTVKLAIRGRTTTTRR